MAVDIPSLHFLIKRHARHTFTLREGIPLSETLQMKYVRIKVVLFQGD